MNPVRPGPHDLQGLPTLTEVIELPARAALPASAPSGAAIVPEPDRAAVAAVTAAGAVSEEQLVERVLIDLQRNADLMLEVRLREALAPIVARLMMSCVACAPGLIQALNVKPVVAVSPA